MPIYKDTLVFSPSDHEYEVELMFDDCIEGTKQDGNPWYRYTLKCEGTEYTHFAEPETHKQLRRYKKGDILKITNHPTEGLKVFTGFSQSNIDPTPTPSSRKNNYGVTWGMCINNAVRIVIAKDELKDVLQRVNAVADGLMNIAVDGLEEWERRRHEKDQNKEPNRDDLPF